MQASEESRDVFGPRIKAERLRLGMTQEAFGTRLGVSKPTQVTYESGLRIPDLVYLSAAAKIGVDISLVMTGQSSEVVAAEHVNWELMLFLHKTISEWEQSKGVEIEDATKVQFLDLFYRQFTNTGSIDPKVLQLGFGIVKTA